MDIQGVLIKVQSIRDIYPQKSDVGKIDIAKAKKILFSQRWHSEKTPFKPLVMKTERSNATVSQFQPNLGLKAGRLMKNPTSLNIKNLGIEDDI